MPAATQDTEITLGTGRMLLLFFALVAVCAVFFAIGFSLGRKTGSASSASLAPLPPGTPAAVVRPTVAKSDPSQTSASDFSFYKAVEQKTADSQLPPQQASQQPATAPEGAPPPESAAPAPVTNGYYVQVAAVTRQEDADALVEALKKKQYPAFIAAPSATDKLFHVQVGPFADVKDAELMRGKLVADGYNPILKR